MPKVKKEVGESIELNKVREMIRKELDKRYGGVTKFLNTEKGKEFGGMKIRPYLYDTGTVNFDVISKLCEYLGIGILSRKLVVSREYFYALSTFVPDSEKTV